MPSGSGASSPQPGVVVATPAGAGAGERRLSNSSDCSTGSGNTRASSVEQPEYLQAARARVSRAPPPRPAANPLQFVKVGPADLYRSAQEQLKRSEEVKKSKEVTKVEQEDWQSNLDSWKSSRRKRVEHIIEKCVEVKRLTDEASTAAARRRAKTFNEMLEESRSGRRRRCPLALYTEEEATDFSDLGIGTSSTKSSLSEDCDAHSLASDGVELEKNHSDIDNMSGGETERNLRKFGSSANEYDTCTTATISSPEPEEYTYEGAIESYKSRVICKTKVAISDAPYSDNLSTAKSKDANGNLSNGNSCKFSVKCVDKPALFKNDAETTETVKKDIPKVDILKRREMFEKEASPDANDGSKIKRNSVEINGSKSIKDRLSSLGKSTDEIATKERSPNEIGSLKDRMILLKKGASLETEANKNYGDIFNTRSLKERLSSLQRQEEEVQSKFNSKKTVAKDAPTIKERLSSLDSYRRSKSSPKSTPGRETIEEDSISQRQAFHRSMDDLASEESGARTFERIQSLEDVTLNPSEASLLSPSDTEREDSGVHTADGSCAVSQADDALEMADLSAGETQKSDAKEESAERSFGDSQSTVERAASASEEPASADDPESLDKDDEETLKSIEQHDISVHDVLDLAFRAIDDEDEEDPRDGEICGFIEQDSLENCICDSIVAQPRDQPKPETEAMAAPVQTGPPIYENVVYNGQDVKPLKLGAEEGMISFPLGPPPALLEPPKEKPPPPPTDESLSNDAFKRVNSTRRIKKEIRNKRTSFLGIEGDDDSYLEPELKLAPRPDITMFLQEESRYEKMYKTTLSKEMTPNLGESCDSGLDLERANSADIWAKESGSGQHSRQNSEPLTLTSVTSDEDGAIKADYNAEQQWHQNGDNVDGKTIADQFERLENETAQLNASAKPKHKRSDSDRLRVLEEQVKEQQINGRSFEDYLDEGHSEEVLRVERELLQLEQEELKRQRISLLHKENQARKQNNRSLQDISGLHLQQNANHQEYYPYAANQMMQHRKSMPNLVDCHPEMTQFVQPKTFEATHRGMANVGLAPNNNQTNLSKRVPPPLPPAKPLRSAELQERENSVRSSRMPNAVEMSNENAPVQLRHNYSNRTYENTSDRLGHHPMTRNTLQNLSAAPRSRLIQSADWMQAKRKSEPPSGYNYNQHWLIQEAEQRRIEQQQQLSARIRHQQQTINPTQRTRHLPDAVIQTLTQRVQNMTSRAAVSSVPKTLHSSSPQQLDSTETGEKMLSVSGRKKCSHCGEELGRGAAMIIESLGLFYHLACFTCSVCGTRLGDGRAGADVRVRSRRLHCHQCYSSDDGVNFSCV